MCRIKHKKFQFHNIIEQYSDLNYEIPDATVSAMK